MDYSNPILQDAASTASCRMAATPALFLLWNNNLSLQYLRCVAQYPPSYRGGSNVFLLQTYWA